MTIDKIKFIKPTTAFNRPRTGLWLAKKNLWRDQWEGGTTNSSNYEKQITYEYKVKVNMTNIFMITIDNFQNFFKLYKTNKYYNINWKKFIKDNPFCKGIYLTFDPNDYKLYKNIKFPLGPKFPPISKERQELLLKNNIILENRGIPYVKMFVLSWLIPSLCVWDKTAILDFKLIDKK